MLEGKSLVDLLDTLDIHIGRKGLEGSDTMRRLFSLLNTRLHGLQ